VVEQDKQGKVVVAQAVVVRLVKAQMLQVVLQIQAAVEDRKQIILLLVLQVQVAQEL
jgi:hypothetical protein